MRLEPNPGPSKCDPLMPYADALWFSVLLDTSVLYPMYLRDTLLRVAEQGLYRPLWSQHILGELARSLRDSAGIESDKVGGLVRLMASQFPDSEVNSYEALIESIELPDPDDRHVVAAAVKGGAGVIVTANVRDFPSDLEERYGVSVQSPDDFLLERLDEDPNVVRAAVSEQVRPYANPPMTIDELLDRLGLPGFAAAVRSG